MTSIYNRFEVINNVLYLVITASGAVNDGASHTGLTLLAYNNVELSSNVASKIYDVNGNNVAETLESSALIANVPCYVVIEGGTAYSAILSLRNGTDANRMTCNVSIDGGLSLGASDKYYITARTFLTLI